MKLLLIELFIIAQLLFFVVSREVGHTQRTSEAGTAPAIKKWSTRTGNPTTIIGHRGEKVLMPEHTLGSYEIACIEGADYVEPDLVLTKDLHLICYHDLTLKGGTNIEQVAITDEEIRNLKKNFTGIIGTRNVTILNDWFIPDLTLEQIKKLKVVQKDIGVRPQYFNSLFPIPSFEEYLEVIGKMSAKMNSSIGLIPELKHPDFINANLPQDFTMENKALEILAQYGYPIKSSDSSNCKTNGSYSIPCGHIVLQSFDKRSLEYLKTKTDIELMMLVDDDAKLLTRNSLKHISTFATYYSIFKEYLYSGVEPVLAAKEVIYDPNEIEELGGFISKDNFVTEVHNEGLLMSIYTLYDSREPSLMGCASQCRPENKTFELYYYFGLGVDAMFVENIKEANELRLKYDFMLENGNGKDNGCGYNKINLSLIFVGALVGIFRYLG